MKNIFDQSVSNEVIARINTLTPTTPAKWGKMTAPQMLAHCNVTYELVYDSIHPKPSFFMKFIMKTMVKKTVVNDVPYPKNGRTGDMFIITGDKDFSAEKTRLINYINKAQQDGASFFEGKESDGFGKLTAQEWNNLFYKHLDHHLTQFGY
ncbi:MAG: DUF1569 domain-containing protein [Bacteroidia bacterium]